MTAFILPLDLPAAVFVSVSQSYLSHCLPVFHAPPRMPQVRVWLRPMAEVGGGSGGDSSGSSSGSDPGEADFAEYAPAGGAPTAAPVLGRLARGWTAFVVGVVAPRGCDG